MNLVIYNVEKGIGMFGGRKVNKITKRKMKNYI